MNNDEINTLIKDTVWKYDNPITLIQTLLYIIKYADIVPTIIMSASKGYDTILELFLNEENIGKVREHHYVEIYDIINKINRSTKIKSLALYHAIFNKHIDTALMLLKYEAQNLPSEDGSTPLIRAIMNHFPKQVIDLLIDSNININYKDQQGRTALSVSFYVQDYDTTKKLLKINGQNTNTIDTPLNLCNNYANGTKIWITRPHTQEEKSTMLIETIISHNTHHALILLESGFQNIPAFPHAPTPLMLSIYHNSPHILIDALIDSGINIDHQDSLGQTALYVSVYSKNYHVTKKLITEQKAKNTPDINGLTPLMICIKNNCQDSIICSIIDINDIQNINACDNNRRTALHEAIARERNVVAQYLYSKGGEHNLADIHGVTPLMLSIIKGTLFNVFPLEGNIENINSQNEYGETALHLAARANNITYIFFLIRKGASDIFDINFTTPSMIAQNEGYYDNMQRWLSNEKMHNITLYSDSKYPQLYKDIQTRNFRSIEMIVNKKISLDTTNQEGISPLILAVVLNDTEAVSMLLKGNLDINFQGHHGHTALFYAVRGHNFNITKILLDHGASPNILSHHGTPLMVAVSLLYEDLVQLILSYDSCIVDTESEAHGTALFHILNDLPHTISQSYFNIAQMLLSAGASIKYKNNNALLYCTRQIRKTLRYIDEVDVENNRPDEFEGYTKLIEFMIQQDICNKITKDEGTEILMNLIFNNLYLYAKILIMKGLKVEDHHNCIYILMNKDQSDSELLYLMIQKNIVGDIDNKQDDSTALAIASMFDAQILIEAGSDITQDLWCEYADNDYINVLQDYQRGIIPKDDSHEYRTAMLNKMYYLLRHLPKPYPNEPQDDYYKTLQYRNECKELYHQYEIFHGQYIQHIAKLEEAFATDKEHHIALLSLQVNHEIIHTHHGDYYQYFSKFHNAYQHTPNKILFNKIKKLISSNNFIINSKEEIIDYLNNLQPPTKKQNINVTHTFASHKRTHDEISDNSSDINDSKYTCFDTDTNITGETKFDDDAGDVY